MSNIKEEILAEIEKNVPIFRKVSDIRYRIRCIFCGDSQSDPREAHMYLKCDQDPTTPITYYCFRANCGAKGAVGKGFLDRIGAKIDGIEVFTNKTFNKISQIKKANVDIITGTPIMDSPQIKYIEHRLGKGLTYEDYDKFKIIWDMNALIPFITNNRVKNSLPTNADSISFLSDDKSAVLTRFFYVKNDDERWKKTKLFSLDTKSFYTVKMILDLFTAERIVINIAEGIMDILSVYKNFNDGGKHVHIASLGADYVAALNYAIANGFIGSNISIRIYIDSNIDEKILGKKVKKYTWVFNSIDIIKNIKSEDFGTRIDNIKAIEYHV